MSEQIPKAVQKIIVDDLLEKHENAKIAEMVHEASKDLSEKRIVYRLKVSQKDDEGKILYNYPAFSVKAYEEAILLQLGQMAGLVPEGLWEINEKYLHPSTEIIWINKSEFKTRWGLTDAYLKDQINIGAYGSLVIHIEDPKEFFLKVISEKNIVEREQVDDFIFDLVVQAYKEVFSQYAIDELISNRDTIKENVFWKIQAFLEHWGLEIINLEVEGYRFPPQHAELGKIAMDTMVYKAERSSMREMIKEDIETVKIKTELEREKQKYEDAKVLYEKLGLSEYGALMEEIHSFRQEMHQRFDSLEDLMMDVINVIPDTEEFIDALYAEDKFADYLENNENVLKAIKKLTKTTKKSEKMIKLLTEEILEKQFISEISLQGGIFQNDVYVISKVFNAEVSIRPKLKTKIKKVKSTLPIVNAWLEIDDKQIKKEIDKDRVIIDEKLEPGYEYIIRLELENPEEPTPLLIESELKPKIHGKKYPVSYISEPIDVKTGPVGWIKAKQILKKGVKFAVPILSKRVGALISS